MNSQETNQSDCPESAEPALTIGLDNAHLSCAGVCGSGSWERMDGKEIRWQWTGGKNIALPDLLGTAIKTHRFASVSKSGNSIHLCKLSDGGIVSYEFGNGIWLHTLNTLQSFRIRVFDLNLVPLETLRYFLTASQDDFELGETVII